MAVCSDGIYLHVVPSGERGAGRRKEGGPGGRAYSISERDSAFVLSFLLLGLKRLSILSYLVGRLVLDRLVNVSDKRFQQIYLQVFAMPRT